MWIPGRRFCGHLPDADDKRDQERYHSGADFRPRGRTCVRRCRIRKHHSAALFSSPERLMRRVIIRWGLTLARIGMRFRDFAVLRGVGTETSATRYFPQVGAASHSEAKG